MSPTSLRSVFRSAPAGDRTSDADLLAAFAATRDEEAFAEVVRRHGRLVRGTARRLAGDPDAAADAFQATFLLLARKAAAVAWGPTVGPWLYQVACRTARKARGRLARRPAPVVAARDLPAQSADPAAPLAWAEVRSALDDELARLPAVLRDPLVLCYLEGLTRDEAAAALGCSAMVLKGRLERGRQRLRGRLARRGLTLSAALAGVLVTEPTTVAADVTARAAAAFLATGAAPPAVRELMRGAAPLGWPAAGLVGVLTVCAVAAVGFAGAPQTPARKPAGQAVAPAADPKPGPAAGADDPLPPAAVARLGTTRLRTGDMVQALAFAPDGKRLAAWGNALYKYDQFTLWDAATGARLRSVRTTERRIVALAWTPDGHGLAVLKSDELFAGGRVGARGLALWDFAAERPDPLTEPRPGPQGFAGVPGAPPASFDAAALSADGKLLFAVTSAGEEPGPVRVYEAKPAKSLAELKELRALDPPPVVCPAVSLAPDGKFLVGVGCPLKAGKPDGAATVVVWDTATGKVARQVAAPAEAAQWNDFYLAAANGQAALGLGTGDTLLIDLKTGESRTLATAHKGGHNPNAAGVFAVAFSPDGKTLATAGIDGMVRLTDVRTGKVLHACGPHASWPQAVAFSRDGTRLASGGQDGMIRVWDTKTGADACPTGGHPGTVWQLALSADGKTAVTSAIADHVIHVWDAATGKEAQHIDAGAGVASAGISPDGRFALAVLGPYDDPQKKLRAWDVKTGKDATPAGFRGALPVTRFWFTPDGKTLLTAHEDKLAAWGWPSGNKKYAVEMPKPAKQPGISRIESIAVSPDGRHLAVVVERYWFREEKGLKFGYGGAEGVDLFDAATGKRIRRLVQGASRPAVFAADGNLIVTGATRSSVPAFGGRPGATINADIALVDPLTGAVLREFAPPRIPNQPNSGHAVVLSADGRALFRATADGSVEEYEVATGGFRRTLPGHRDTVVSLAAAAGDSRRLASGSLDTTALVWDVGVRAAGGKPAADPDKLWEALGEADAEKAFVAMAGLAADPAGFITQARSRLRPTPPGPTAATLDKIVADLDSPAFVTRDAARRALDELGEAAVAGVRVRLEKTGSEEVRARLSDFLARYDSAPGPGPRLRQLRALEVLEHLGTADARAVLADLAAGGPSRLTAAAADARKRLEGR